MSGYVVNFYTKSGSIYRVDREHKMVKSIKKVPSHSPLHEGRRLPDGEDWKEYESLNFQGVGHPLYFWWGNGRDEHSETAVQVGDGPAVSRCTWTSPVVRTEIIV